MKIEIKNYTKKIHGVEILRNINLEFQSGICYGLQGKNGSGKTMLMRAISGLIFPTEGSVFIDGKELGKDFSFPDNMGLLIENPAFLSNFTGKKNLQVLADIRAVISETEIDDALTSVGLDPLDKRKYRKYSLGMKQRLGIAAAFMERPDLIILDEPVNAIDSKGVMLVRNMICRAKERGAILIIACHDQEELYSLADQIIKIEEGAITEIKEITEGIREKNVVQNLP